MYNELSKKRGKLSKSLVSGNAVNESSQVGNGCIILPGCSAPSIYTSSPLYHTDYRGTNTKAEVEWPPRRLCMPQGAFIPPTKTGVGTTISFPAAQRRSRAEWTVIWSELALMAADMECASRCHDWHHSVCKDGHVQKAGYPNKVLRFKMLAGINCPASGWAAHVETAPAELLCSHGGYLRIKLH